MKLFSVPKEIENVTGALQEAGFQAYLVGGCVRDMVRVEKPKDWDVATDATPDKIQKIFPHAFYENEFGTVGVVNDPSTGSGQAIDETLKVVEVTPFRIEGKYTDGRRPDTVHWSKHLSDDLKRRDFTMNAIAYDPTEDKLVDPFGGQAHIKDKMIVAVGEPEERFAEDYLRMLRAVRFSAELGFAIEVRTMDAIRAHAKNITAVSAERVREEFSKLVMSARPKEGIEIAHELGILAHIAP
ncbi:MAG: CCA tRNA nucleotidyltransferase, partial [Patescibacteria group bacterium]